MWSVSPARPCVHCEPGQRGEWEGREGGEEGEKGRNRKRKIKKGEWAIGKLVREGGRRNRQKKETSKII